MGNSEKAVKDCLVERHKRENYTLATKLPIMMLKDIEDQERIFNEQLHKCGVEYFDYYLLHNLTVDFIKIAERLDSFGFIRKKKEKGLIKNIGFSFHDNAGLLDEILTVHPEVDFVQLQINYLDWDNEAIQSGKCYEVARKHCKDIVVMEPVKGGTLARLPREAEELFLMKRPGMSIASWAIRFAASLDSVMTVLSGMSDKGQLIDNMSYMENFTPFTRDEHETVQSAVTLIRNTNSIPCTACRYCVDGCPRNIAIPEYFALYNTEKLVNSKGFSIQKFYYDNYTRTRGKASDCIECNQCGEHCPQHIPIITHLKKVAEIFE